MLPDRARSADDPLHKPLDLADPFATVQRVVLGFPTAADTGPKLRPASPTGEAIPQPSVGDRGSLHSHGPGASESGLGGRRRSAAPSAEERRFAVRGLMVVS